MSKGQYNMTYEQALDAYAKETTTKKIRRVNKKMVNISVHVLVQQKTMINALVKAGYAQSISELIRNIINEMAQKIIDRDENILYLIKNGTLPPKSKSKYHHCSNCGLDFEVEKDMCPECQLDLKHECNSQGNW